MICPSCTNQNDERRRYCGQCGHNLRPVCVRCAFTNDATDKFCGGCGGSLQPAMSVAATPAVSAPALPTAPATPVSAVAAAPPPAVRSLPTPVKLAPMPAPAKSAVASLPVPAPAAVPAAVLAEAKTSSAAANGQPMVTAADLDFLIESKPVAKPEDSSLPARVTQSDLDSLFGDLA